MHQQVKASIMVLVVGVELFCQQPQNVLTYQHKYRIVLQTTNGRDNDGCGKRYDKAKLSKN